MSANTFKSDPWLSFGLAFVGGYGDAAGFVLAKTFTGHVTGSLVLAAIAIATQDWRATLSHLSAVGCFLAGIFFSVLMARPLAAWPSIPVLSVVMGIEVILIAAGCLALASHLGPRVETFVVCVSLALGLQNGAFRRTGGISVHTTYLTGLITGLLASKAEQYAVPSAFRTSATPDPKSSLLYGIWFAFVLGAAAGAAIVFRFSGIGILGAAIVLFALTVRNSFGASRFHPAVQSAENNHE